MNSSLPADVEGKPPHRWESYKSPARFEEQGFPTSAALPRGWGGVEFSLTWTIFISPKQFSSGKRLPVKGFITAVRSPTNYLMGRYVSNNSYQIKTSQRQAKGEVSWLATTVWITDFNQITWSYHVVFPLIFVSALTFVQAIHLPFRTL